MRKRKRRKRRNGRREERWGVLACEVAFVFKIFWRGANERKGGREQEGGA